MNKKKNYAISREQAIMLLYCIYENKLTVEDCDIFIDALKRIYSNNPNEAEAALKAFSNHLSTLTFKLFAKWLEESEKEDSQHSQQP